MSAVMLDDAQLTDVLDNWRRYQRAPDLRIGWPKRSSPFQGAGDAAETGPVTQSDYYADVDEREARIVDTVIHDLPLLERTALFNVVLGTRRPIDGNQPLQLLYLRARAMLRVRLAAKGIG
jgi:hypothetical protein